MKIGDKTAPWFPEQWGPETYETRRCPHGLRFDDYCEPCENEEDSASELSHDPTRT